MLNVIDSIFVLLKLVRDVHVSVRRFYSANSSKNARGTSPLTRPCFPYM